MKPKLSLFKPNKTALWVLTLFMFASAFFIAGVRYERSNAPVRLPANRACLEYASAVSNALTASQSRLVAVIESKPEPTVDYGAIEKQLKDCRDQADDYQVTMKGSK